MLASSFHLPVVSCHPYETPFLITFNVSLLLTTVTLAPNINKYFDIYQNNYNLERIYNLINFLMPNYF